MNKFKLHQGVYESHNINKDNFKKLTHNKPPYKHIESKGKSVPVAVCPSCDNPIQLVGIYKERKTGYKPYAKHYPHTIAGLAEYNKQAYNNCPYASHSFSPPSKDDKKDEFTEYEKNIYIAVREHFDQAIYILQSVCNIYISDTVAEDILDNFIVMEGWMYPWITINNIPWMLLYLYSDISLYHCWMKPDNDFYDYLTEHGLARGANIIQDDKINSAYKDITPLGKDFFNYAIVAAKHNRRLSKDDNNTVIESIELELTNCTRDDNGVPTYNTLVKKSAEIDETWFTKLINSKKAERFRRKKLMEMASKKMKKF